MTAPNVLRLESFGSLLYVRRTHEYLPFDRPTTDVLLACRETSLFRLPPLTAGGISPGEQTAFFRLGRELKFLNRAGVFQGRILESPTSPDHLQGPLTLHLSVTQSCDLNCRHCFAAAERADPDQRLLTHRELIDLFAACAELGCQRVALTGGEPLNRPDIFEIMDQVASHGLDACLTTNGLRIDRSVARNLSRRPMAWVNVSLDGAGPATNDPLRGPGTFHRVTTLVKKHFKWRIRFGLSVTLHRRNLVDIPRLPGLARELGAEVIMLRGLYPVGAAVERPDLHLSFGEYQEALRLIEATDRPVRLVPTSCETGPGEDPAVVFENFGCAAGNTAASVAHNGLVSPCSLIGVGALPLDSLRERCFADIWRQGAGFRQIRGLSAPEACRACPTYPTCSGGCRARAWAAHASLEAPDPWCDRDPPPPAK